VTKSFLEKESQADIGRFRPIFDKAVTAAKAIAQRAGLDFYDILEVRFYTPAEEKVIPAGEAATWRWDDLNRIAYIAIRRSTDPEALTHEVGHSLYHPSPLHDRNGEPKYGDKFCNAFRYFVHPEKGTDWMAKDGGEYDASALIAKCRDLNEFADYFVALCATKRQDMSKPVLGAEVI
jgi:hypothetical protein